MVGRSGKHGGHIGVTARLLFGGLSFVASLLLLTACEQKTTPTKMGSIKKISAAEILVEAGSPVYEALSDQERVISIAQSAVEQGGYGDLDFMLLNPIADRGNADAQFVLGMILSYPSWRREGSDIEQNNATAHAWFLKAAKQGHDRAAFEAAQDFYHGQGTTKDDDEALRWYEVAAEANHVDAQSMAGTLYFQRFLKSNNTQELSKSVEWLEKAADSGDEHARSALKLVGSFMKAQSDETIAELVAAERAALGMGLIEMAGKGNIEEVKELLAKKPYVNLKDHSGNTALIVAAANGHAEIARLLLEAGADRTIKNDNGKSAVDVARDAGHAEIVTLLQR